MKVLLDESKCDNVDTSEKFKDLGASIMSLVKRMNCGSISSGVSGRTSLNSFTENADMRHSPGTDDMAKQIRIIAKIKKLVVVN